MKKKPVETNIKPIRSNQPVEFADYGESVIPDNRLNYLVKKCRETLRRIPGNVLEVGVYKGGTFVHLAELVKEICPQFRAIGIDTFSGHPYSDGHEVHAQGKYGDVNLQTLKATVRKMGLAPWTTFHIGEVENIFHNLKINNVSFAHIDCDLYIPIKFCALNVPIVMNHSGIMYFDDYGHEHCPGATKAVDEVWDKGVIKEVYMKEDNTTWSCYISV